METLSKINRHVLFLFEIPLIEAVKTGCQFWNFSYFFPLRFLIWKLKKVMPEKNISFGYNGK